MARLYKTLVRPHLVVVEDLDMTACSVPGDVLVDTTGRNNSVR